MAAPPTQQVCEQAASSESAVHQYRGGGRKRATQIAFGVNAA